MRYSLSAFILIILVLGLALGGGIKGYQAYRASVEEAEAVYVIDGEMVIPSPAKDRWWEINCPNCGRGSPDKKGVRTDPFVRQKLECYSCKTIYWVRMNSKLKVIETKAEK